MGEVAAAVTAGALTVADGAAVICRRSALLAARRSPGAMWAVQLGEAAARQAIGAHADRVSVGVVNSSGATVLSGDAAALAEIAATLRERDVFCRQVQVDYASHGPGVEPLRPGLLDALDGVRPRAGRVPVHSTVHDRVVDGAGFDAAYWADNLIRPVRFASAVQSTLADRRPTLFVEISAHPILHSALEDGIADAGAEAELVASLRRGEPELATLLAGAAAVYAAGGTVAFDRVNAGGRFVDVPTYSWQHRRFWVDGGADLVPEPQETLVSTRVVADPVRYLRECVSALLGVPDVDPSTPLVAQGLDSVFAAQLAYQLRADLGRQVTVRDLLGVRSIEELALLWVDQRVEARVDVPVARLDEPGVLRAVDELRAAHAADLHPGVGDDPTGLHLEDANGHDDLVERHVRERARDGQ
jgi:acyl transferase domain-containing protein